MTGGGGGGEQKSTTVLQTPPPTADELALQQINLQLAERQVRQFDELENFVKSQQDDPINQEIRDLQLARLRGEAIPLSPEQTAQLDTLFEDRRQQGFEDISRFARESAAARGLRQSDSPIVNSGLDQLSKFQRGLQSARAGAELDFGNRNALFQQQAAEFQNGLQQQAFLNRQSLANPNPIGIPLAATLAGLRTGNRTKDQTVTGGGANTLQSTGSLLGGAGGLASGAGSILGAFNFGGGG